MIAADSIEGGRSPNQKEDEPVAGGEAVEQSWVLDTAEQPYVLVMIAADSMEGSKSPNQKEGERVTA